MFKILAINYSQSGQLTEIVNNFITEIKFKEDVHIDRIIYDTKDKFQFPWTSDVFFNTMPESVLEEPLEIEKINYKYDNYDLVIFGYSPWFLSPSIPATSLLKNEEFQNRIKNTKVITLIGSRNMWINSQESIKASLRKYDAKLIGNIPLVDKHNNSISAITILYWMLTGKKDSFLGIFPKPGVSEEDINGMHEFGKILANKYNTANLDLIQKEFINTGRINISTNLMFVELRGKKLFMAWAKLIKSKTSSRKTWVNIYKYYLLVALFIVAPILLTILNIFVFPFTRAYFKNKKTYFCGVE